MSDTLNPGITRTVQWLRAHGFHTTDSGDGKTNVEAGIEGALTHPHVFMVCNGDGSHLCTEAERLWSLVKDIPGAHVEANYSPGALVGRAVLLLFYVGDAELRRHFGWR